MNPSPDRILFTLIHGTWAKNATWTSPESSLAKGLQETLAAAGVHADVEPFEWSGRNSGKQRQLAARRLVEHVERCSREYPKSVHLLVGHSHGGTVALQAAAAVPGRINGVACLSTPFIHCTLRHEPAELVDHAFLGIVWWIGVVTLLVSVTWWPPTPKVLLWLFLVSVLSNVLAPWLCSLVMPWILKRSAAFEPPPLPQNLLIVRVAGDEASGSLGFSRLCGWFAQRIVLIIPRLQIVALVVSGMTAMSGIFTVFSDSAKSIVESLPVPFWLGVQIVYFPTIAAALLTAITAVIAALLPLIAAMMLVALVFGRDAPLVILVSELSAEETPSGDWITTQLSFDPTKTEEPPSFFEHSRVYFDKRTWVRLAQWALQHTTGQTLR